jgi:pimeloyl-ACP methyl ester carboxylesterase
MRIISGTVTVQGTGIDLAYEAHGDPNGVPLVLVHGHGEHLTGWHPDLLRAVTGRGYRVVVFDNRDVGMSTHLVSAGRPDLPAVLAGDLTTVAYRLEDMAEDTVGILDALGLGSVHLLGVSMGGMIAQLVALGHPDRVRSLTSVMSHSGDREVRPSDRAAQLLRRPAAASQEEFVLAAEESDAVLGSPEFRSELGWVRDRARLAWGRRHDPDGVVRQLAAVVAAADRGGALASLRMPVLVVHGTDDELVPPLGGRRTAAAIPTAELLEIDGMGHDLPRPLWDRFLDRVDDVVDRGEAAWRGSSGLAQAS